MKAPLGDLDLAEFTARFWQQKPCLVRQAFPGFSPALDENDVAGLACDELAESRLVTGSFEKADWNLRHGPFKPKELRQLPDTRWTLLVQDVEKHYPPLQDLMSRFDFIPGWRMDDLMVSVSAPGGSVGPHVDEYDVFLLQASGRRSWQIAAQFDRELQPNCDLKVLCNFQAEEQWELEAGDMLYLPPGIAHHGVALDQGMTWSIGLRAPSQADLLLGLGEWLAREQGEGERYRDHRLPTDARPGEVSPEALLELRQLLASSLTPDARLDRFLAHFLSQYRLAHHPAASPDGTGEEAFGPESLLSANLQANPWTRMAWIEKNGQARLFAAGQEYACSTAMAVALCRRPFRLEGIQPLDIEGEMLLRALIRDGHLYLAS